MYIISLFDHSVVEVCLRINPTALPAHTPITVRIVNKFSFRKDFFDELFLGRDIVGFLEFIFSLKITLISLNKKSKTHLKIENKNPQKIHRFSTVRMYLN